MRLIIVILLCGCCTCAFANEPVGKVTFVEGVADVLQADGQLITLREGEPIELKDRIRTKSYSKVKITLADESVLKLAASSCVSIEEFSMAASGVRQRCVVRLSRGKAEATVAKTGAADTFIIETPNARGAVKGSDIFVSYAAGKTGMFVDQGAMSVVNPAFPGVERMLVPGTCVFIPPENPPAETRQVMKTEMTLHKRDVEPQLVRKWVPSESASVMNAVIISFAGTVRVHKASADDWSAVANGDVITEGDKLQTGEDGQAEIKLGNGNTLFIESSTELIFTSLRYDPASGNYHNQLEVTEGEVLAVVEKIRGESTFEVRTPTAVSGVRGTIMRVVVEPPQPGMLMAQTQVFFEGGRGDVVSLQSGVMQQLLPGQNVRVDASGIISQPIVTSVEERAIMLQSVPPEQMAERFAQPKEPLKEEFVPLPPPLKGQESLPLPPPPPGGDMFLPPPPPPFDQFNPDILYKAPLVIKTASPNINSAAGDFKQISLKSNGTWSMIFNGAYFSIVSPGWNLQLQNTATGDLVSFTGIQASLLPGSPSQWAGLPTSFSGQVKGPEVDRTLNLDQVIVVTDANSHLTVDARGNYNPL